MAGQNTDDDIMANHEEDYDTSSDEEMEEGVEDEVHELTEEEKAKLAEAKKAEGNGYYTQQKYLQALQFYNEAIELCPNCAAYYGNRSATYFMLKNFSRALEDSRQAVQIDPNFIKGHLRIAKCHCAMGEIAAAINTYQSVLDKDPTNITAQTELQQLKTVQNYEAQGQASYDKKDFRKVVFCMDRCIECSPGSLKYKIRKAECLALLKRYQESQEIVNDLLRLDNTNADAIYVRGMCLYYQDNVEKAYQHFQKVLRLAPDHSKARETYKIAKRLAQKKEAGNQAFRTGKLQLAYDTYTEALSIDPLNVFTNAKLYCNRATVLSKQGKYDEAVEDCCSAIELDENYIKAYQRRAKCYLDKEMYEESVRDYEQIYKMDKSRENKQALNDAKLELKKSKRKDYYKLLGIQKNAGDDEIKKAYKKRAMLHHPDRHSNATEAERKEQEKKFKEIGEAYAILSDPKKKQRYDTGQDLEDMGAGGFADVDPNQVFQMFFGGGGGGGGGFPGMGGHGHGFPGGHFQQQQSGFPGGFSFQFG